MAHLCGFLLDFLRVLNGATPHQQSANHFANQMHRSEQDNGIQNQMNVEKIRIK